MRRLTPLLGCFVTLMLSSGCANSRPAPVPVPEPNAVEVEQLEMADVLMRRGLDALGVEPLRAVALFRQAFLALPAGEVGDERRDLLIAGMIEGWQIAYAATSDPAYLEAATLVLERWLAKHHELFGESPALATRARMRILFEYRKDEIDERLNQAALARAERPERTAPEPTREREPEVDTHAGENLDGDGVERRVEVKSRIPFARFDDPRVMAWLRHPTEAGASLFDGDNLWNDRRPLVRVAGFRGWSGEDRFARALARKATGALESCYDRVIERDHRAAGSIHIVHQPESPSRPFAVLAPPEFDAVAIHCVERALADSVSEGARPHVAGRMRVDFFWQRPYSDQQLRWPGLNGTPDPLDEYQIEREKGWAPIDTGRR